MVKYLLTMMLLWKVVYGEELCVGRF